MNEQDTMTPLRPHLFRAFYNWLLENGLTPYILVDARLPQVFVPEEYVNDGMILLSLMPSSTKSFVMDQDKLTFDATFGGVGHSLDIPFYAIKYIRAKEVDFAFPFQPEACYEDLLQDERSHAQKFEKNIVDSGTDDAKGETQSKTKKKRPQLKLVDS